MSHVDGLIESAPTPIPKLAKEYTDLSTRAQDAARNVKELEGQRRQAEVTDRRALAEAMRAGESDPGPEAAETLEAKIKAATRDHQALLDAARLAHDDLVGELTGPLGTRWAADLREQRGVHACRAAEALTAATSALSDIERFRASDAWLADVGAKGRLPGGARRPAAIKVQGPPGAPLRDHLARAHAEMQGWGASDATAPSIDPDPRETS